MRRVQQRRPCTSPAARAAPQAAAELERDAVLERRPCQLVSVGQRLRRAHPERVRQTRQPGQQTPSDINSLRRSDFLTDCVPAGPPVAGAHHTTMEPGAHKLLSGWCPGLRPAHAIAVLKVHTRHSGICARACVLKTLV